MQFRIRAVGERLLFVLKPLLSLNNATQRWKQQELNKKAQFVTHPHNHLLSSQL